MTFSNRGKNFRGDEKLFDVKGKTAAVNVDLDEEVINKRINFICLKKCAPPLLAIL
jgi:hypothetical protein